MPIALTINGEEHQIQDRLSVAALLAQRGLDPNAVVVELNLAILPKEAFAHTLLEEKDRLEILRFVGGG